MLARACVYLPIQARSRCSLNCLQRRPLTTSADLTHTDKDGKLRGKSRSKMMHSVRFQIYLMVKWLATQRRTEVLFWRWGDLLWSPRPRCAYVALSQAALSGLPSIIICAASRHLRHLSSSAHSWWSGNSEHWSDLQTSSYTKKRHHRCIRYR